MSQELGEPSERRGEKKERYVLEGDFETTARDRRAIRKVMAELGFEVNLTRGTVHDKRQAAQVRKAARHLLQAKDKPPVSPEFRFADIESESDFLIREHVEAFFENVPEGTNRTISAVWHRFVDGKGNNRGPLVFRHMSEPIVKRGPLPFEGVEVIPRTDLGIEPYQGSALLDRYGRASDLAEFAVKVSGVLRVDELYTSSDSNNHIDDYVHSIAEVLRQQIAEPVTE